MIRHGIRRKLLLLTLGPTVAMLLLLFGYFSFKEINLLQSAMYERGITVTRYLSAAAEFGVATGNLQQLHTVTSSVINDEVVSLRIYDMNKRLLLVDGEVSSRPELAVVTEDEPALCDEDERLLVFCAPINVTPLPVSDFKQDNLGEQVQIGSLEVAFSTDRLLQKRDALIARSAAIALLILMLALYLARRTELQITRPLLVLSDAVERVEQGKLDVQLEEDGTGELVKLQQGFNAMIAALTQYRDDMAGKVDEATVKLREALESLEQKNRDLEAQRQRAEIASMGKSQFLATMSHEIRTPLSGMIGMLSLLEHEHDNERQREHVQHLLESASALRMLIDEILDFSRIEAGKLTIMEQPFSPCGIIDDVAVMLAPSAHYKELEFILDIDPRMPHKVVGDPLRFRQVLINLLGNAIKFTTEGYVLLRAIYDDGKQDGVASILFEVIDTGIGIEKANQQQVFESFTQLDSGTTKRFSGSGLGTTVSRELVHLMGGDIGLESEPGEGSRFWFTLNWKIEESAKAPQQVFADQDVLLLEQQENSRNSIRGMLERLGARVTAVADENALWDCVRRHTYDGILLCEDSSGFEWQALAQMLRQHQWDGSVPKLFHVTYVNGDSSTTLFDYHVSKPLTVGRLYSCQQRTDDTLDASALERLGPFTILLVEDNAINAKVIMHLLQSAGHKVVHVQAGGEALEAMRGGGIDAALMDVRMPGMDGLTATRLRREEEQSSGEHIPIIALTANDSKEDREACLAAGMDDFLVKPVNAAVLATILQRYCVGL